MNLPNKLTIFRMFMLIPFLIFGILFILWQGTYSFNNINLKTIFLITAGSIFVAAMLTDYIDGRYARKHNLITSFGKLFDPLADKLMTSSAFIILSVGHIVPIWITVVMIVRDIIVDGLRNTLAKNNKSVAASFIGKAKTMIQSIGIIIIFVTIPFLDVDLFGIADNNVELIYINIPLYIAVILSIYGGFNYFKIAKPYLNIK